MSLEDELIEELVKKGFVVRQTEAFNRHEINNVSFTLNKQQLIKLIEECYSAGVSSMNVEFQKRNRHA